MNEKYYSTTLVHFAMLGTKHMRSTHTVMLNPYLMLSGLYFLLASKRFAFKSKPVYLKDKSYLSTIILYITIFGSEPSRWTALERLCDPILMHVLENNGNKRRTFKSVDQPNSSRGLPPASSVMSSHFKHGCIIYWTSIWIWARPCDIQCWSIISCYQYLPSILHWLIWIS